MSRPLLVLADAIAILILVYGLYFPRYRRRDMVVSILGVNVGVMAVATVLGTAEITAGLGLGLFGVLSIIRLRSNELDHEEIAYYFSALALGLLGGVAVTPEWVTPTLMAAIIVALYVGDHPRVFAANRNQAVVLDRAYTNETELIERLEELLGGKVQRVKVKKVDLVSDTTNVDVRFRLS